LKALLPSNGLSYVNIPFWLEGSRSVYGDTRAFFWAIGLLVVFARFDCVAISILLSSDSVVARSPHTDLKASRDRDSYGENNMTVTTAEFAVRVARRIADPVIEGLERHIFLVPVVGMPLGISLDPNARRPKTNKRVYRKVEQSLLNEDVDHQNTFHLKNKGITLIAKSVKQLANDRYAVEMVSGIHGIVDGGHTYDLITKNQKAGVLPENQYVTVEVRVGVPQDLITDIAGGLNTSVQVQAMSLDNLDGLFQWIKDEIKGEPYFGDIAWSENDDGSFDARDILSMLACFNIDLYPNDGAEHPVHAYEKKSKVLAEFEISPKTFQNARPILKEILRLYDVVRLEYYDIWNKTAHAGGSRGAAGALSFSEKRQKGLWQFPFIQKSAEYRMVSGPLYAILAALRWYVVADPMTGKYQWRGSFDDVLKCWREDGYHLLRATKEMSDTLGRNPQSVGKSRPHWANLHNIVAKRDLERRAAA
jgi:hypothetical protein